MNRADGGDPPLLILGIGNVLMGDEGVGVEVVNRLEQHDLPSGVECLDGGTGGFILLEPLQRAGRVILVDATADGAEPGTLTRLRPRFARDYPPTLTAHDVGLKDLLDAAYLLGKPPDITLFAVSIRFPQPMRCGLSDELSRHVPVVERAVLDELHGTTPRSQARRRDGQR